MFFAVSSCVLVDFLILYFVRFDNAFSEKLFEEIIVVTIFQILVFLIIIGRFTGILRLFHVTNKEALAICFVAALVFFDVGQFTLLNIERSRSFYVIAWVAEGKVNSTTSGVITQGVQSFEALNPAAVSQRVIENKDRGLFIVKGGKYQLTTLGQAFLKLSNFLAKNYRLRGWFDNKT
jgi:hypothetical protein